MKHIIFLLLLLITVSACRDKFCRTPMPAETQTLFEIRKGGKIVADSELRGAYLFWIEGGIKTIDSNRDISNPSSGIAYPRINLETVDSTKPLFYSTLPAGISAVKGIKDFYLAYANGSIDTLTIDYRRVTEEQDHCTYTTTVLNEIKYRGAKVPVDSSLMNTYQYAPIYIINK